MNIVHHQPPEPPPPPSQMSFPELAPLTPADALAAETLDAELRAIAARLRRAGGIG